MASSSTVNCHADYPPADYEVPRFPALCWPPWNCALFSVYESWRFTLLWTVILFTAFHLSAVAIALLMQIGKPKSRWKYLGVIPILYAIVAGVEAFVSVWVLSTLPDAIECPLGFL
ncbi:hypothetical protein F5Y16DRAFT_395682 [Xylariaceae sp. FL0255]|nr:hypothetical protein F5Y16DRAFT_395682 [Xylariaceae sp. FL0255]